MEMARRAFPCVSERFDPMSTSPTSDMHADVSLPATTFPPFKNTLPSMEHEHAIPSERNRDEQPRRRHGARPTTSNVAWLSCPPLQRPNSSGSDFIHRQCILALRWSAPLYRGMKLPCGTTLCSGTLACHHTPERDRLTRGMSHPCRSTGHLAESCMTSSTTPVPGLFEGIPRTPRAQTTPATIWNGFGSSLFPWLAAQLVCEI